MNEVELQIGDMEISQKNLGGSTELKDFARPIGIVAARFIAAPTGKLTRGQLHSIFSATVMLSTSLISPSSADEAYNSGMTAKESYDWLFKLEASLTDLDKLLLRLPLGGVLALFIPKEKIPPIPALLIGIAKPEDYVLPTDGPELFTLLKELVSTFRDSATRAVKEMKPPSHRRPRSEFHRFVKALGKVWVDTGQGQPTMSSNEWSFGHFCLACLWIALPNTSPNPTAERALTGVIKTLVGRNTWQT